MSIREVVVRPSQLHITRRRIAAILFFLIVGYGLAARDTISDARWIAIRLLDGDASVEEALASGQLAELVKKQQAPDARFSQKIALQGAQ